jgi:hypothetical protein
VPAGIFYLNILKKKTKMIISPKDIIIFPSIYLKGLIFLNIFLANKKEITCPAIYRN